MSESFRRPTPALALSRADIGLSAPGILGPLLSRDDKDDIPDPAGFRLPDLADPDALATGFLAIDLFPERKIGILLPV